MGHTDTPTPATMRRFRRMQATLRGDPLDAMRGILVGVALSVLGFWLPLALILGG